MTTRTQPEAYCQADPVFYDLATRDAAADPTCFAQTSAAAPAGWVRSERDVWVVHTPDDCKLPGQGWKIHISAVAENADRIVDAAWTYCLARRIPFKFLRSRKVFTTFNLKYAPRASSGKLVTIYPRDEAELGRILYELGAELDGEPGPYILTDLRWGSGPLYVRYGGFVSQYCLDEEGRRVLAIEGPDGALVPDRRRPVFEVPAWVPMPTALVPALAARDAASNDGGGFPYTIESALHFSNGGGVYQARDREGREVVLKEARPCAGLDGRGRDAVARLYDERDAMRHLAGTPGIPELYEHRIVWEHHFLAIEKVAGDTLQTWVAREYPLTRSGPSAAELTAYRRRVEVIAERLGALIAAVHARGMVFGDLHPGNVIVNDADEVFLVDFELAVPLDRARRLGLGHPGFVAGGRDGVEIDHYALAAIRLWLLFPLNGLLELDPGRAATHVGLAEQSFDLPPGTLDALREELGRVDLAQVPEALRQRPALGSGWAAARDSMAEAILLSATPQRTDRLFPGDVRQFQIEGETFAHGAAGVLWALHTTGHGRHREHEEWLLDAVSRRRPSRPGFYDGAHGVAYVLEELGHRPAAERLLDRPDLPRSRDVGLYGGLSGLGLNLLHFARRTGDPGYRDRAEDIADRLAGAVSTGLELGISAGPGRGSRAGLLHGWSGAALFFLHLWADTGDESHLEQAAFALHRDLALCTTAVDGSLQVNGGYRVLPYLEVGSAGIALVAAELLRHRPDDRLERALDDLLPALGPAFTVEPHLFNGRAGLLAALAGIRDRRPGFDQAVERHLSRLHWHAMGFHGHLAFPGEQLRRLSMDLATGSAGILLAITAAAEPDLEFLPFLAPLRRAAPDPRRDLVLAATTTSHEPERR
jgi:hypothetical protein